MTKQKGLQEIIEKFVNNVCSCQKYEIATGEFGFDKEKYDLFKIQFIQQIEKLFIFNRLDDLKEYVQWQYSGKKVLHRGNLKTMLLWIDEIKENLNSDWLGGENNKMKKQKIVYFCPAQNEYWSKKCLTSNKKAPCYREDKCNKKFYVIEIK